MSESKVIPLLRDRSEIEAAVRALANARTEPEGRPHLLVLAGFGPAVIPVILRFLDTPDPWMVRALGRVLAQVEDRAKAAGALRRAILSPASSDRRRIVAMVLLDQFLEQVLDEALFAALGNPTEVAVRALLGETPVEEKAVRLDYLSIIHAQPLPEILAALEHLRQEASAAAVDALRFFALDESEAIAEPALEALGAIRQPDALAALRIVASNGPSSRRKQVERVQRKLLLSGVPDLPRPQPPPGARVLVSPLDGAGNRLVLFLFPRQADYEVLHVFLDDEQGVRGAYEMCYAQPEISPAGPPGTVHPAPHPWEGILLQEVSWAYARCLLQEFLSYNEAHEAFCPLEYRFFCDKIWAWEVAEEERPALPALPQGLSQYALSLLLGHPGLVSWFLESEAILEAAKGLQRMDLARPDGQGLLALTTVSLVQSEFTALVCMQYARRLRDTAEWLLRAGETELAAIAAAAAEDLDEAQPLTSIFALMLVQKGLLIAAGNLRQGAR